MGLSHADRGGKQNEVRVSIPIQIGNGRVDVTRIHPFSTRLLKTGNVLAVLGQTVSLQVAVLVQSFVMSDFQGDGTDRYPKITNKLGTKFSIFSQPGYNVARQDSRVCRPWLTSEKVW